MDTNESQGSAESLAEIQVALRLNEVTRKMAVAEIQAPLQDVALSAAVAERLLGHDADPRLVGAVSDIREAASRAMAQLRGLFGDACVEVDLRVTDLSELLGVALEVNGPLARARGVHIVRAEGVGSVRAICDRVRALCALTTAVSVALSRSARGASVRVSSAAQAGELRVVIEDEGEVLSDEALEATLSPAVASPTVLPTRDLGAARRGMVLQGAALGWRRRGDGMALELAFPLPPSR